MGRFGFTASGNHANEDGSEGAPVVSRKKSSKDIDVPQTRVSKELAASAPSGDINEKMLQALEATTKQELVFKGAGTALDLPEGITKHIQSLNCESAWILHLDHKVRIAENGGWIAYSDATGQPIYRHAGTGENGHGVNYVLMIRLVSICEQHRDLKKAINKRSLESQQQLAGGKVPQYVPDSQTDVIETRHA